MIVEWVAVLLALIVWSQSRECFDVFERNRALGDPIERPGWGGERGWSNEVV